jgi:hypothetical protein
VERVDFSPCSGDRRLENWEIVPDEIADCLTRKQTRTSQSGYLNAQMITSKEQIGEIRVSLKNDGTAEPWSSIVDYSGYCLKIGEVLFARKLNTLLLKSPPPLSHFEGDELR